MTSVAAGNTAAAGGLVARARTRADALALAPLLAVGGAFYYVAGRGLSFFFDESDFVLGRRANAASAFLDPHNGHLSVVPVLIYKALWAMVGLRHYGPYRLVDVALHLVCVTLLYLLVRRRVGPALALVAAAWLLFLGRAWQDLIWPFQIGYLGSLAAALGAFVALERRDRLGDAAAAALLAAGLACSGLGVAGAIAVAAGLALEPRGWRRLWLVALPGVLYGLWYASYGEDVASFSNLPSAPAYLFDSFAGAVAALLGFGYSAAAKAVAGVVLVAAVACVIARRRFPRAAVVPTVALLAFWTLTALARAQLREPAASRYLYPGALFLLLVGAGIAEGMRPPRWLIATLALLVVATSALNLHTLRDAAAWRGVDRTVDAELGVVQLERQSVEPAFQPDPSLAPQVTAGPCLAAVDELGSPAIPPAALPQQSPDLRLSVDGVLARAIMPHLVRRPTTAAPAGVAPHVEGYGAGRLVRLGGCVVFTPTAEARVPPSFDLVLPRRGLLLRSAAPLTLFLRRFADAYPTSAPVTVPAGRSLVRPPADASSLPWHARIAPARVAVACVGR